MISQHPIFVVFVIVVVAPLLAQTRAGSRVPVVVIEVLLGVLIGPHVLHLIEFDSFLSTMRAVGMVAVLFMAGMEIDFKRIRGRPLSLGVRGWITSLGLVVVIAHVGLQTKHMNPDTCAGAGGRCAPFAAVFPNALPGVVVEGTACSLADPVGLRPIPPSLAPASMDPASPSSRVGDRCAEQECAPR